MCLCASACLSGVVDFCKMKKMYDESNDLQRAGGRYLSTDDA